MNSVRILAALVFVATPTFFAWGCGGTDNGGTTTTPTAEAGPSPTPTTTGPTGACRAGDTDCAGSCASLKSDNKNCGACGKACEAGLVCSDGACALACQSTQTNCSGSCRDLKTDTNHCGACDKKCAAGQLCSEGACVQTCSPLQRACPPGPGAFYCANVAVDSANCGTCGNACADGFKCVAGSCELSCPPGLAKCATSAADAGAADASGDAGALTCVDIRVDSSNCGACGNQCVGGKTCTGSLCCNPGNRACGGACTDVNSDKMNCGACGKACSAAQICSQGVCKTTSFNVLDKKDITYQGINYVLLKVSLASNQSTSDNWCTEYTQLCESYGALPTGCGSSYTSQNNGYGACRTIYKSDGVSNTLGCNPSGNIANAAVANGYADANSQNSFGFHFCDAGSCSKTLCSGSNCSSALSYIDASKPFGYTLCKK